jgi:hypothetical protein
MSFVLEPEIVTLAWIDNASVPFSLNIHATKGHKLSASERGLDAASLSLLPQLSLNSNLVGSFTLKRPEGRAPTNRQLLDAPVIDFAKGFVLPLSANELL